MKPLAIAFIYNELPYLPLAIDYYKAQGCDIFIIDNYSNDGSFEWLQQNNIPNCRVDTGGAFHLEKLQQKMIEVLHELKPDWFLWFAPDLFFVFDKTIAEQIEISDKQGYTSISLTCCNFKNTGENFNTPLYNYFEYYILNFATRLCVKYHPEIRFEADFIFRPYPKNVSLANGVILEYGGCKPKAVQEEKLRRRRLAWEQGLNKNFGIHYNLGKQTNWIYQKTELIHISQYEDVLFYVNKLRNFKPLNH